MKLLVMSLYLLGMVRSFDPLGELDSECTTSSGIQTCTGYTMEPTNVTSQLCLRISRSNRIILEQMVLTAFGWSALG